MGGRLWFDTMVSGVLGTHRYNDRKKEKGKDIEIPVFTGLRRYKVYYNLYVLNEFVYGSKSDRMKQRVSIQPKPKHHEDKTPILNL